MVGKVFADGQVAQLRTTLWTASYTSYIKLFTLSNISAVDEQLVSVFINSSGVDRLFIQVELKARESARIIERGESLTLEAGDYVRAETTSDYNVDYLITGVEDS